MADFDLSGLVPLTPGAPAATGAPAPVPAPSPAPSPAPAAPSPAPAAPASSGLDTSGLSLYNAKPPTSEPSAKAPGKISAPEAPATVGSTAKQVGYGLLQGIPNAIQGAADLVSKPLLTDPLTGKNWEGELARKVGLNGLGDLIDDPIHTTMGALGINPNDLPQPQNAPERIANMAGQGAVVMAAPELAGGEAGLVARATSLLRQGAVGAAGGAAGQAGAEVAPEPLKPAASILGNIIGGMGAEGVARMGASGASAAGKFVAPFTQAGRARAAGDILYQGTVDPEAALGKLNEPHELVPGSPSTLGQVTGDPGILNMEKAYSLQDRTGAYTGLRADQNAANLNALEGLRQTQTGAEVLPAYFSSHLEDIDRQYQELHDEALADVRSKQSALGGGQPTEAYGSEIKGAIDPQVEQAQAAARGAVDQLGNQEAATSGAQYRTAAGNTLQDVERREDALWQSLDPNHDMHVLSSPITAANQKIYGGMSPEEATTVTSGERAISDVISNYGDTLPLDRLAKLRSVVSQAMRQYQSPLTPNSAAYGRMSQIRAAIEGAIEDTVAQRTLAEHQAVAAGTMEPGDTLAAKWAADAEKANAPEAGTVGKVAGDTAAGPPANSGAPAAEVGAGGAGGGESAGVPSPETVQAARPTGTNEVGNGPRVVGRGTGEAGVPAAPEVPYRGPEGRQPDGSLQGLPRRVGNFEASAFPKAHEVAQNYMEKAGLPYRPPSTYARVDPARAKRIADAYDAMEHDPQNPEVKAAYKAMIDETMGQYQAMLDSGLKVEFIPEGAPDPYGDNPRNMTEDVRKNNHMWVFPTKGGFGSDAHFDPQENPLLAETPYKISGQTALANDIFRAVHDYFGHVKEGVGFRADGEENAWRSHSSMYSPLARRAMTSETRGQNSWVNYGPHGETNRTALSGDTHYADQKTGLLPDWVANEGAGDAPLSQQDRLRQAREQAAAPTAPTKPEPAPAPNMVDAEAAQRLRAASEATKSKKTVFGAEPVRSILKNKGSSYEYNMPDASVAASLWQAGPKGGAAVSAALRAAENSPEAVSAIQNVATADLRSKLEDGILTQPQFNRWRNAHADALASLERAAPGTIQRFEDAAQASQALDKFGGYNPKLSPSALPGKYFTTGEAGFQSVNDLRDLMGRDKADKLLGNYAADSMRASAVTPDGTIDPAKFEVWRKSHAGALRAMPELGAKMADAAKASENLAAIAKQRKDALDALQKSAVGKIMQVSEPSDVARTVGRIFERSDASGAMKTIADAARKNPDAFQGLRNAIIDHIQQRLVSNTEAATSGRKLIRSDRFQDFVAKNRETLSHVFSPEDLQTMQSVAANLERANRSINGVRIPGGSDTAQKLYNIQANNHKMSILQRIITEGIPGTLGFLHSGPLGAYAGISLSHTVNGFRDAGIAGIDQLVDQGLRDPEFGRVLLQKASQRAGAGSDRSLLSALKRISMFAGVMAASRKAFAAGGVVNPGEQLFDRTRLSSVPQVPQFDLPRYEPKKGPSERVRDVTNSRSVFDKTAGVIESGMKLGGKDWYNTEPLRHEFERHLGHDEGNKSYKQFMDFVAATSPRSKVPENVRNASYYYHLWKNGQKMPEVGTKNPKPYGHLAQRLHQMNAARVAGTGWDALVNPKPASFAQNLSGNQSPATVDTHAFRLPAILAEDPRFLETDYQSQKGGPKTNIREAVQSGRMPMSAALGPDTGALWESKPAKNEYGAMEQFYKRLAQELGMTPAQAQASAWVGGADRTNMESDATKPFLGFLEDRVNTTAKHLGIDPQQVLAGMIKGKWSLV